MMIRWLSLIVSTCVFLSLTSPSYAKRIALVIGNNAYDNVTRLEKAENDAESIGQALKGIGYSVIMQKNLNRRKFNQNMQLFLSQLEAGDEALFFFAGHGVEIRGENYLLPTDIPDAVPWPRSLCEIRSDWCELHIK